MTSPFSSHPLCIVIDRLIEADLAEFRWNQAVLLIWRDPDREELLTLFPQLEQVFLQVGSDENHLWRLYYGESENVHAQTTHK